MSEYDKIVLGVSAVCIMWGFAWCERHEQLEKQLTQRMAIEREFCHVESGHYQPCSKATP